MLRRVFLGFIRNLSFRFITFAIFYVIGFISIIISVLIGDQFDVSIYNIPGLQNLIVAISTAHIAVSIGLGSILSAVVSLGQQQFTIPLKRRFFTIINDAFVILLLNIFMIALVFTPMNIIIVIFIVFNFVFFSVLLLQLFSNSISLTRDVLGISNT